MLAGYLPYADQIEDSDVIIISKDGVHLYQASAAGIGGGLRYWVETEDEIYRVADITALSALTYDPTEPVYKYTWHGAPMSESNIQHAVYTALDSSGKQPDYLLPEDSELSKAVNDPTVPINPVTLEINCLPESNGYNGAGGPKVVPFDYCRDFNQLYIGWTPITVTWYDQYDSFLDYNGRDLQTYIYDLNFQYNKWRRSSPEALSLSLYPSSQSTYTTEISGEDLYNDLKDAILDEWDSDTSGDGSEEQLRYTITQNQIDVGPTTNWINGLRTSTYENGSCNELLDTYLNKIGYNDDPTTGHDPGDKHATPGSVEHNYYDRRIGKYASVTTLQSEALRYQAMLDAAQAHWDEVYDPVENPHPGGFENYTEYENWYIAAMWTSTEGGGYGPVGNPSHDISHGLVTKEIPFIVIASCVGYYPDYEVKPISGEETQDIDYPRGNYATLQGALNFPGYGTEVPGGSAYKPSYGETANFSDSNNYWSAAPGTTVQRILRGPNICIDYKDDNGYVWEIGLFATSENYISGDNLEVTGANNFLVKLNGSEDYTFKSLSKIELDSSLNHWVYNSNFENYLGEAFVISRGEDVINIYAYNTPTAGAGEAWINNARNIAATIVRETGLKAFKAFEGSQITVRTNIGVNTNEGFKTGLEVVDFDDVKKFEETSYVDPVTGAGWFKGTLTANGGLVQKKLKAGTGITITPGEKEDTISADGGGGGSVDVDTVLALMEKGPGITPIKDVLNNKIRIDLKHDINVKNTSKNYISIERSYKEDPQEPGTLTNEYVDDVDLKMTAIRNDIYNASHMVKGTGGLDFSTNPGTGQVTISTDTISNITVNGEPTTKSYDSETGKYNVDLQISSGGDDYDIPLPIPDYVNRVFLSDSVWYTPQTYTAPSDGVLFLEASYSDTVSLPVTIDSFTWKLGRKANGVGSRHDSHNMIFVKEGTVLTFGTRVPSSGWASNASTSGIKLWFIPFETINASEFDGDTTPYILPYPDYSTRAAQISSSSVPTIYDDPSWYTYTSTVDGIMVANPRSTAGNYIISPLDDNDNVVGTYLIASSSGESQLEHDYLPIRKGKKYKIQKTGNPFDINIFAYKTTSGISELYSPYLDFSNPISKSVTTSSGSSTYYDLWGTGEGDFPALLINNLVEPASLPAANLRIKTSNGALSEIKLVFYSSDNNNPSWPLMPSSLYSSKYQVLSSYYDSGDLKVLKYQKFEPPVAPKRILYDGQNLVDSNGDVDLTFLKQLIDGLDARITALGG